MKKPIIYIEETNSTNTEIKNIIAGNPDIENLTIVYTGFQTAGRGQRGNKWESEKGKNLTFSVFIRPESLPANEQFLISEISSLSVLELLERYCGNITIKWPNDIYYKDRKICGILIENTIDCEGISYSISGIGININQEVFLSDAPNPISLSNITGMHYDLQSMIEEFYEIILYWFKKLKYSREDIHKEYLKHIFRKNKEAIFTDINGKYRGVIIDVEPHGRLVIRDMENRLRIYGFKEVAYVI